MSKWRVEQHYGFGAARIPIQPQPHQPVRVSLAEGMAVFVEELTEGGVWAAANRAAGEAAAALLAVLIFAAVAVTLMGDHSDVSRIEMALFETVQPEMAPILEAPVPVPVPAVIPMLTWISKPKPRPETPVAPNPPAPRLIAKRPPPKPIKERTPTPVQKIARPRIVMDAVETERSAPTPRVERIARTSVDRTTRARLAPQMQAPAAPALNLPAEAPFERAFRIASTKSTSSARPRAMAAVVAPSDPIGSVARSAPIRPSRMSGLRPRTSPRVRTVAPVLSAAPARGQEPDREAISRRTPHSAPSTTQRRAPRPSGLIARADTRLDSERMPPSSRSGRASRQAPPGPASDHVRLAGVPLAELAACLTDREEDRLKQAVVAAVTTQEECISRRGTYRFVETKNLNSFLMWIDRASGGSAGDRCDELRYALECLDSARQHAAR